MVQSFKRGRGSAQYDNTDNLPPFELEGRHPNWPKHVRIVEVGMRDGLQNEQVSPCVARRFVMLVAGTPLHNPSASLNDVCENQ